MSAPVLLGAAIAEWLVLHRALDDLADAGRRTPCQVDPDPFTSEDRAERKEAEQACAACPVTALCRQYAEAAVEPYFVWGGVDRAPSSRPRKEHR